MNTLEPLLFRWEGDGIRTDENYNPRLADNWSETADFIFHQAASELCNEISTFTIREKYNELIESEVQPIEDVISSAPRMLKQRSMETSDRRTSPTYYVRGDTVIIPSRRQEGLVRLVSNNKNSARDLRDKLSSKISKNGEKFRGAGISNVKVYTESEFTIQCLDHPNTNVSIVKQEPDEFESRVLEELKPQSQSHIGNIKVKFEEYSPEPEFDIIQASGYNSILQIEVKDFSGTDNEPGEEDVIHRPLRKASLLNIAQTFSVVKGVSDGKMKDLNKSSELRNNIAVIDLDSLQKEVAPLLERAATAGPAAYYTYGK